jgi:PEP-CTERM motif
MTTLGTSLSRIGTLSLLIGFAGSPHANAVLLTASDFYLQYINNSPSVIFGAGGQQIRFGAAKVLPNGDAMNNGVGVATTGTATTINTATNLSVTRTIPFDPGPVDPYFYQGIFTITNNPIGNRNPANLMNPWTITFSNPATSNGSVSDTISLQGGEIPFVNSVTLSGTSAAPTFSWSPPPNNTTVNGYKIDIYQNNLVSNVPPLNSGVVVSKDLPATATSYTVNPADFTVHGFGFMANTDYTLAIVARQTRDNMPATPAQNDVNAVSFAYSSFRTLPNGTPPVNLPTVTLVGNQVVFGFSLAVQPGITYYLDPEVATGYIYQIGAGNPNIASVSLPDIGNPAPYDLYLWNGSNFAFDQMLAADTVFDFAPGGVSEFEVLGVDPALGIDPNNTTAFITGLTFESAGNFTGTMTPVTVDVAAAPEPGSLALLASGLFGLVARRYRRGRMSRDASIPRQ